MSDSQRPIPPTPGYHSAPGTPPEHRATPGVPATPGYHSPQMEYLRRDLLLLRRQRIVLPIGVTKAFPAMYLRSQLRRKMAVIKRLPANRLVLRR